MKLKQIEYYAQHICQLLRIIYKTQTFMNTRMCEFAFANVHTCVFKCVGVCH